MNRIIREEEIKKTVFDTSISINQRERIFEKIIGKEFSDNSIRPKILKVIDEIIKIHSENILEHMQRDYR